MTTVKDFGARGDGRTDDTEAIQHAIAMGDGELLFPRGDYVLSRSLQIPLRQRGRLSVSGAGGTARLIMTAAGPALHLVGTHQRNAAPESFAEGVWQQERMPTVRDLEIVGAHAAADGVRAEGAMQPTFQQLLIRRCRHGIHLATRDRNVLVANCHIYHNSGVGIFLDRVNLHQTIIEGSHISYNKQGGIMVAGSEIRNLQIVGNDIEYNYDADAETSADVLFDCREGTVREGTIVGNTIQAVQSPGGANVRFVGVGRDNPNAVGLFAVTGNLIGSQETAVHLQASRGVVVSGNSIYSGFHNALLVEDCDQVVIGPNSIDHNPEYRGNSTDRVVLRGCRNVNVSGLLLQHTLPAEVEASASLEVRDCDGVNITGCQIVRARVRGIHILGSRVVRLADCTVRGPEGDRTYRAALVVEPDCRHVMACHNFLGRGADGGFRLPEVAGVAAGNVEL